MMSGSAATTSGSAAPPGLRPQLHELILSSLVFVDGGVAHGAAPRVARDSVHVCFIASWLDGAARTSEAGLMHSPRSIRRDSLDNRILSDVTIGPASSTGRLSSPPTPTQARRGRAHAAWPDDRIRLSPPGLEEVRVFLDARAVVAQVRARVTWVQGRHTELYESQSGADLVASVGRLSPPPTPSGAAGAPADEGQEVVDAIGQGVLPLRGLCDGREYHFEIDLLHTGLPAGLLLGTVQLRVAAGAAVAARGRPYTKGVV